MTLPVSKTPVLSKLIVAQIRLIIPPRLSPVIFLNAKHQAARSCFCAHHPLSMKVKYTSRELLELRHEGQISAVSTSVVCLSQKLFTPRCYKCSTHVALSYLQPSTGTQRKATDPDDLAKPNHTVASHHTVVAAPFKLANLPAGATVIRAAAGTPIPANAIPISFVNVDGTHCPIVSGHSYRAQTGPKCKFKYELYDWHLKNLHVWKPYLSFGKGLRFKLPVSSGAANPYSFPAAAAKTTGDGYAGFFEPYVHQSENVRNVAGTIDDPASASTGKEVNALGSSCGSDSITEYSSDSFNVLIKLPAQ